MTPSVVRSVNLLASIVRYANCNSIDIDSNLLSINDHLIRVSSCWLIIRCLIFLNACDGKLDADSFF